MSARPPCGVDSLPQYYYLTSLSYGGLKTKENINILLYCIVYFLLLEFILIFVNKYSRELDFCKALFPYIISVIFSNTFLLPVNGSKNSILNLNVEMFFKSTSYQNLWKYEITKPTIHFQSQLYKLISSSMLCLDPYIVCSTIALG